MSFNQQRFIRGFGGLAIGAALVAHLCFLLPTPLWLQSFAALLLTGWLPAALLLTLLFPPPERTVVGLGEHLLYIIGTGYGISVTVMLGLSYLPGPIPRWLAFLVFDLLLLMLGLLTWWRAMRSHDQPPTPIPLDQTPLIQQNWLLIGLVTLALVGGGLRFPHLGYAEFQGDEARAMLRAAEVISGFDSSLFEHRKGPTEILLPAAPYVLIGRIDEAAARLPFAFANFCGLFALFLLGWRWFGALAGWVAAMLLALDGYLIAFARIVQYQSIVFLMVMLVLLLLQRLTLQYVALNQAKAKQTNPRVEAEVPADPSSPRPEYAAEPALAAHLTLASFLLATGLLSHYEAILVILPALLVLWQLGRSGARLGRLVLGFVPAILVGALLLAAFYIPFVRYPTFGNTFEYLAYKRIGEEFAYNNLADYFLRSTLYSSTYAFGLMSLLAVVGLMMRYWRGLGRVGLFCSGILLGGVILSLGWPQWLTIGGKDFTWLFYLLALGLGILMPDHTRYANFSAERIVWLWFGAVFILSIFFTATPNTHVYNFYFGWALVCGVVVAQLWQWLSNTNRSAINQTASPRPLLQYGGALLALSLTLLFGYYQYSLFIRNDIEVLRTWPQNRPWGYWTAYAMPIESSIFGFPHRNSWKSVDVLIEQGVIDGAFDTNTKDWIVDWYTRGLGSCPRDHRYFVLADMVEPAKTAERLALQQEIGKTYALLGAVVIQGEQRLQIYEKEPDVGVLGLSEVRRFDSNSDAAYFDRYLAGPQLAQSGRVVQPTIEHPLNFRLGDTILLIGYTLDQQHTRPGGEVKLTLYWHTLAPMTDEYTVFTQLINREDARKVGQRDGQPVCGKLPTTDWRPGDVIADPYYIPVDPSSPFGTYNLLIGMYPTDPNQGSGNLTFYNSEGQPLGQSLSIDEVYVEPTNGEQTAQRRTLPRLEKSMP